MKRKDDILEGIARRLDLITALLLDQVDFDEIASAAQKIRRLLAMGASPSEIARIVGKPINFVTATIAQAKSKRRI
ncbi:MAG: hypothetical protein HYT87_05490 [Nitrospirae bacterium]|nr:hypothetical protein [Nitrospirota bacterium]